MLYKQWRKWNSDRDNKTGYQARNEMVTFVNEVPSFIKINIKYNVFISGKSLCPATLWPRIYTMSLFLLHSGWQLSHLFFPAPAYQHEHSRKRIEMGRSQRLLPWITQLNFWMYEFTTPTPRLYVQYSITLEEICKYFDYLLCYVPFIYCRNKSIVAQH